MKGQTLSLYVEKEVAEEINRRAAKLGVSASRVGSEILARGVGRGTNSIVATLITDDNEVA